MDKSESINELAKALAKAQAEMGGAIKDASNPFFKSKYADLGSVIAAIKKPLSDNGLAYVQATDVEPDGIYLETILMHESGQWLLGRLRMPVAKENDPQSLGSAITYGRRYALQALVGVPAEDDDGNAAARGKTTIHPTDGAEDRINEAQRRKVMGIVEAMKEHIMGERWIDAVKEYQAAELDADSMVYLWKHFPSSKDRAALKNARTALSVAEKA